jgi:hypothetical protein
MDPASTDPPVAVDAVQYAERLRRQIWADMVEGKVPSAVHDFTALRRHVDAEAYLLRAELPAPTAPQRSGADVPVDDVIALVDAWLRSGVVRLPYGAFTPQEVLQVTELLRSAQRSQHDAVILAHLAGEWLAGTHHTTSAGEFEHDHNRELLALTHDVLAR